MILVVCGKKSPGPLENFERLRKAVMKSPERSAPKYAAALTISDHTMRRTLLEKMKSHPNKLAVVLKLNPFNFVLRKKGM